MKIRFNAFSFLRKKLEDKNITCANTAMEIEENISINELIENLGLDSSEVEAVFINHRILPMQTILHEGDRVALVPPGGIPNHIKAYVGATR